MEEIGRTENFSSEVWWATGQDGGDRICISCEALLFLSGTGETCPKHRHTIELLKRWSKTSFQIMSNRVVIHSFSSALLFRGKFHKRTMRHWFMQRGCACETGDCIGGKPYAEKCITIKFSPQPCVSCLRRSFAWRAKHMPQNDVFRRRRQRSGKLRFVLRWPVSWVPFLRSDHSHSPLLLWFTGE